MRECNVDAGELDEGGRLPLLLGRLLASGDLCAVVHDLSRVRDVRNQQLEPLPECRDIVVDLEEQVVLDLLRETGTDGVDGETTPLQDGFCMTHRMSPWTLAKSRGGTVVDIVVCVSPSLSDTVDQKEVERTYRG